MTIPQKIKEAFKDLHEMYEGKIKRLGVDDGTEWYRYAFSESVCIGLPFFYGIKDGELQEARGENAFKLIDLFIKD